MNKNNHKRAQIGDKKIPIKMKRLILKFKMLPKNRVISKNKWKQWTLRKCKDCNMVLTITKKNLIYRMRMLMITALMRL